MNIVRGVSRLQGPVAYPVVALGNFDGVHLGHRKIFAIAVAQAQAHHGTPTVLTFEPHPLAVLAPHKVPPLLTGFSEKMRRLEQCGITLTVCEEFTKEYAALSARDFAHHVLAQALGAREVVVGFDYAFGKDREGDTRRLRQLGVEFGFAVHVAEAVAVGGGPVSSSRIRETIQKGDMAAAGALLGRPYALTGAVVPGAGRGAGIGFPTANIDIGPLQIPAPGVYAAQTTLDGTEHPAAVNIGVRPTFGDGRLAVEAHILDFTGDLRKREIEIRFIRKIRDEIRFPSPDALVRQIAMDVQSVRNLFTERTT